MWAMWAGKGDVGGQCKQRKATQTKLGQMWGKKVWGKGKRHTKKTTQRKARSNVGNRTRFYKHFVFLPLSIILLPLITPHSYVYCR